jgi:hypothetical protein
MGLDSGNPKQLLRAPGGAIGSPEKTKKKTLYGDKFSI